MIKAATLLVRDADKLTLGQNLTIATPHALDVVLKQPPDSWLSNACMVHYQTLLLNPARITSQVPVSLNPANLLLDPDLEAPIHDCAEILAQVYNTRPDLKDTPLPDNKETWFTDGSSFIREGQRYAGAAVTTTTDVVWVGCYPPTQKVELTALTKVIQLGEGKGLNIYTDSRYTFAHIHGAIYKNRGLLTT